MFNDDRVERELLRREFHRNEMDTKLWEQRFPHISFNDKVCVEFIDGTATVCKHLYHDDAVLYDIDWSQVVEVYTV